MKAATLPILSVLGVFFCSVLLAGVVIFAGPEDVLKSFSGISAGHLITALLLVQVQIWLSAVRWRFTAQRLRQEIPLGRALREYYVSASLNLLLPGGMAGDVLRAYRAHSKDAGGWKRPASAVMLERMSGQFAFVLLTGCGLAGWPLLLADRLPEGFAKLALLFGFFVAVSAALIVALRRSVLFSRFQAINHELAEVFWRRGALAVQLGLSFLIVSAYVAAFLVASSAAGAALPFIAAVTAVPLCLLSMMIPVSVGGWGTREAAAAALWPLFGFSAAQGVSASLLYGAMCLAGAAIPAVFALAWDFFSSGQAERGRNS